MSLVSTKTVTGACDGHDGHTKVTGIFVANARQRKFLNHRQTQLC